MQICKCKPFTLFAYFYLFFFKTMHAVRLYVETFPYYAEIILRRYLSFLTINVFIFTNECTDLSLVSFMLPFFVYFGNKSLSQLLNPNSNLDCFIPKIWFNVTFIVEMDGSMFRQLRSVSWNIFLFFSKTPAVTCYIITLSFITVRVFQVLDVNY